ncbi:Na+/H+ antiporter subunit E [Flavobacterium orientale]|uniref:Cation:proton antiporter n=1 Tax=Flavobacterium orientale TaxID=1756020 RepID=A0A916Y1S2_9FLAO|nr:Na+/H+ antiporter subunit E [Flavobacterium orientale]GGD27255.1 cation:proton antiporter [Flavobacterium orientale]
MKKLVLLNLILTIVWVALTGSFVFINFAFGFVLTFLILWVISSDKSDRKYFRVIPSLVSFIFFFIYELIKANIQVAYDVITPTLYMKPGIVSVPLDANSDLEITLLANVISLTPGTLSLDVSDDRKVLYVHAMYIHDKDEFIRSIKDGFEKKLLNITR